MLTSGSRLRQYQASSSHLRWWHGINTCRCAPSPKCCLHGLAGPASRHSARPISPRLPSIAARMRPMRFAILFLLVAASASAQQWNVLTSSADSNLRGISVARASKSARKSVVWACGSKGVVLRSDDDGNSWQHLRVPGGETLDFRGIVAFSDGVAYLMSIGSG